MLLRPTDQDFKTIAYYIGRLIVGLGIIFIIPLITALIFGEWDRAMDFFISMLASIFIGILLQRLFSSHQDMNWSQGLAVTSISWLVAMVLGAIPLYLSGHYLSYLDACFDSMSAFATTGLALIQNLDHCSNSVNMWRHLMMFLGGQGIVVIALTFLIKGTAGAYRMYVGEAREEKVLPNVIQTARFIWMISLVYLVVGTLALTLIAYLEGMPLVRSFLHGIWIFMAAFDTGGFTPQSQSILYYHSFPYELVTIVLMVLGTLNFSLHYALWNRNFREFFRNIETRTLLASLSMLFVVLLIGLTKLATYPNWLAVFRKGFYQLISAQSGTGYMTIYPQQFPNEWHTLSLLAITIAMGIGGSACSTAGGIKALRISIFCRAFLQDIKRIMFPGTAIIIAKIHHIKDLLLEDRLVRAAMIILTTYIFTYLGGTIIGVYYGYPLANAAFESVSAAANVGLSTGITVPTMPTGLKITYIVQMWLGRLEFMSIFILFGLAIARFTGAKGRSK
ncbi:cation transporter [Candidatus Saganbacteria bacterium CG08_land_8_20_14_0_20_45_16]|uniref:Cation transporter n=1 Tax=Candidatus Saganbacteria bacterium CG08_land_8_20_14_0_20_45_16 TaxID=2014293 RepID=A0A2H0Y0Y1_UNCSA|nr:MAG: cation transporter [Candidatus Saganbacteria bacterium CG08_land_8_20_14_0_20_45_16]